MEYFAQYPSPLGQLLLTGDGTHLTGVWMDKSPSPGSVPGDDDPVLLQTKNWLDAYFRGNNPPMTIPLKAEGTPFRKMIWQFLLEVPWGTTCTYGELAQKAAAAMGVERMSAQAVGGAVGRNPISIIIPCHRCVGADGSLTGYAGGMERKQWLLAHEQGKGREP